METSGMDHFKQANCQNLFSTQDIKPQHQAMENSCNPFPYYTYRPIPSFKVIEALRK